jgi:hypothetical protein
MPKTTKKHVKIAALVNMSMKSAKPVATIVRLENTKTARNKRVVKYAVLVPLQLLVPLGARIVV